jgi:Pre-mRNA 3'-end-processing endonuclease polyadenylation factor C-term
VEWEASPSGDMIADAVVALIMHAQSSAASIRLTSKPCRHSGPIEDEESAEQPAQKKAKAAGQDDDDGSTEKRLRFLHQTLLKQFESVETVYDAKSATFEIKLDTALESGITMDEDGKLTCTAKVEFDDLGLNATITVECKDKKVATNVQDCLRNVCTSLAPIGV